MFYSVYMKKRKRAILMIVSIMILLLASLFCFYFSRPLVLYVSSSSLYKEYVDELVKPKPFALGYKTAFVYDNKMPDFAKNARLIVLDPIVKLDESSIESGIKIARWGSEDETSASILLENDEKKLWQEALVGKSAFIYEQDDSDSKEILSYLKSIDSTILALDYSGRISSVNYQEIFDSIKENNIESVLVYDPESAMRIFDIDDVDFYVDFRDWPALSGYSNVFSIAPNWDDAIEKAMQLDSGKISFDYALIPSH